MALSYIPSLRNARLDCISSGTTGVGGSGRFRVYSGTKPATGAAIGAATLLAEMTLNATFAPAATGGVLTLNAITSGTAVASGTPTWARFWKSDGTTAVVDMTSGVGSGDLNFNAAIVTGGTVACSSAVITDGTP
jgi:hypothetical protein